MIAKQETVGGRPALVYAADAPVIASGREAADLIGEALSTDITLAVIPAERLSPDFLRLSSGLAGEVLQKFVNYGIVVAILGDISEAVGSSAPLRDFVRESNRGAAVWFVPDLPALEAMLLRTA